MVIGRTLAHYRVVEKLGEGGMGVVYRARDTRLDRDVAIKVLPEALSTDAERVARFEREAKLLASLNHPNIAGIYGFETAGGSNAIVLELIEGETLADRLARGPIPMDDAVAIAVQIAAALERGHEAGIVHRDLKPANVKLKEDGSVKVLDYGLAKALEPDAKDASTPSSESPTEPRHETRTGVVLGTAGYMSPEQVSGQRVDKRADIWAFGAVLYEMVCGRPAFRDGDTRGTLARVLGSEPDWSRIPPNVPTAVTWLLRRCLRKDPRERLRDIGDARLELSDLSAEREEPAAGARAPQPRTRPWIPWGVAAAACIVAVAAWMSSGREGTDVRAFELAPPAGTVLSGFSDPASRRMAFALSPDGRELAFVARGDDGVDELYVRSLGALEARKLASGARHPFWSPDGEQIAFFTPERELMRIQAAGGPPLKIAEVGGGVRSGTWSDDGTILFSQVLDGTSLIFLVPDDGGEPRAVTALDPERGESLHRWPRFLPDGEQFLYFARTHRADRSAVMLGSLEEGHAPRVLFENRSAAAYASGYLLFVVDGALSARVFDPQTGELGESIRTITGGVEETRYSIPTLSVSENGVIAYGTGGEGQDLVWFDRSGRRLGALGELDVPATILNFQLSPDDTQVAAGWVMPGGVSSHIWLADVERKSWRRWTFAETHHLWPVWSPDGQEIAYTSSADGGWGVFVRALDAADEPRPLWATESGALAFASDWSSDLLISNEGATSVVSATGEVVRQLAGDGVLTGGAEYSPDGAWVAYRSSEGGGSHVFVQAASRGGSRIRVSPSSGRGPRWKRPDEIVYQGPDGYYAVPVEARSESLAVGEARFLFAQPAIGYDVSRDHERFLLAVSKPEPGHITIDTDWLAALR